MKFYKNYYVALLLSIIFFSSSLQCWFFDGTSKKIIETASVEARVLLEKNVYPQVARLIKQSAVALVGVTICAGGVYLFVSQCKKNKICADKKRLVFSTLFFVLGSSTILFSDRIITRI